LEIALHRKSNFSLIDFAAGHSGYVSRFVASTHKWMSSTICVFNWISWLNHHCCCCCSCYCCSYCCCLG